MLDKFEAAQGQTEKQAAHCESHKHQVQGFFFFRMTSILGGNLSIPADKRPNLNWPKQKENGLAVVMSCPEVALSAAQLDPGDPV